jgi:hypothetical protein
MGRKKNIIAPNEERAVVAMDNMRKEIEKAEELYGDGLPFDQARLEIGIKARTAASINMMIQNGRDYQRLKVHLPHGEFISCVERTSGKSRIWAYQCMKMAEMAANNPNVNLEVNIWSVGQFRALTVFEQPVLEEYLKGGPLGDIPHDDVATMPRGELEEEARRLRKKLKNDRAAQEEAIAKKEEKLNELEQKLRYQEPPTAEQRARAAAFKYRDPIIDNILEATERMNRAIAAIDEVQKVPEVPYDALEELLEPWKESFNTFCDTAADLTDAFNNIHVDKGRG